jgi:predicted transcriptional regulator of viral defense system
MKTIRERVLEVARKQSVFRAGDVHDATDPRSTLRRMATQGEIIRVGRGLYALADAEITGNHSFVEATKRYPGGVICLTSALFFHGIGTQMPYEIWMMRTDRKMTPNKDFPIRFVYGTGAAFSHGAETHLIEGMEVSIFTPPKTIADCFKYRNKIGLDVAIEALKEGWRAKRFTMDELWEAAKTCRVQNIIQPYVEMLAQ